LTSGAGLERRFIDEPSQNCFTPPRPRRPASMSMAYSVPTPRPASVAWARAARPRVAGV
jgi:hypothetical protein